MTTDHLPPQSEPRRVLLDYPHRVAGHCGSGALRDLLEWAGLGWEETPSEGLAFGLGGGLGFTYLRLPGLTPPVYFVGRSSDLEVDLLTRVGAEVEVRATDDPVTGWGWVRRELQQGRPVLLWADIAELPYLAVRLQMSRHAIVVIGYDDDTATAFVVDNDRADVQEVPYAALARARASRSFPVPTRHTTYFVNWPRILPDLRSTAASALVASVENMQAAPTAIMPDTSALPPDAVATAGISGVADFAEDVDRWQGLMSETELDLALQSLHAFVEKRRAPAAGCSAGCRPSSASTRRGSPGVPRWPRPAPRCCAALTRGQPWLRPAVATNRRSSAGDGSMSSPRPCPPMKTMPPPR